MYTDKLSAKAMSSLAEFVGDLDKRCEGMTYAELFDFFMEEYGICVTFVPVFTFALIDHIAYSYLISVVCPCDATLEQIADQWYGSFGLEADSAIDKVMHTFFTKKETY